VGGMIIEMGEKSSNQQQLQSLKQKLEKTADWVKGNPEIK